MLSEEIFGASVAEVFREHRNQFRFEIDPGHPSGTFWYHAHKHGATQSQVASGLVGPLIVRDRPDSMPAYIAQAEEKVWVTTNVLDLDIYQIALDDLTLPRRPDMCCVR